MYFLKGKRRSKGIFKWIIIITYLSLGAVILMPGFLFENFYFFKNEINRFIQPAFAIAWTVFFLYNLRWGIGELRRYLLRRKYLKGIKTILKELDEKERAVLREFHFRDERIIHVPLDDKAIKSLCRKGILILSPKGLKLYDYMQPVFLNGNIKKRINRKVLGVKRLLSRKKRDSFINGNRPDWVYQQLFNEDLIKNGN